MEAQKLRKLLYEMMRIRLVEEKICDLYSEQQMRCPVHFCVGQEAIPVGVCANLNNSDYVFGGHRSHGHYLAKGGCLKSMIAELYGKVDGCSGGKGGSMHLIDLNAGFLAATPIVGSTVPIAVGAALGSVLKQEPRVTVVFFGDAVVEEGVFCESLNFAALKKLPIVFVCENNGFSVYSPLKVRQPPERPIFKIAEAHGVRSLQSDGNDVREVFELSKSAVEKARSGQGPSFLEFATFRWREHCGPSYDDDLHYRDKLECEIWLERCPVKMFSDQLCEELIISHQEIKQTERIILSEIEEAVLFAKQSPFPSSDSLCSDIYSN
jgi:TPP-dependent pyruvate/acetoin dehydrogenase alpha subunit